VGQDVELVWYRVRGRSSEAGSRGVPPATEVKEKEKGDRTKKG